MEACSRKIALDSTVNLEQYAARTEGFSGADLQALVYNAHLDAIHATLSNGPASTEVTHSAFNEEDIEYTSFGGAGAEMKVLSRAERASVTKRVRTITYMNDYPSADILHTSSN